MNFYGKSRKILPWLLLILLSGLLLGMNCHRKIWKIFSWLLLVATLLAISRHHMNELEREILEKAYLGCCKLTALRANSRLYIIELILYE